MLDVGVRSEVEASPAKELTAFGPAGHLSFRLKHGYVGEYDKGFKGRYDESRLQLMCPTTGYSEAKPHGCIP